MRRYALSDKNDVLRPDGVARASGQRLRSRRVWRSIQQNKRLRFIGFCQPLYLGAGGQFESENISGCVARRFTKISDIVAGLELQGNFSTKFCQNVRAKTGPIQMGSLQQTRNWRLQFFSNRVVGTPATGVEILMLSLGAGSSHPKFDPNF